jgi:hypothetical protein
LKLSAYVLGAVVIRDMLQPRRFNWLISVGTVVYLVTTIVGAIVTISATLFSVSYISDGFDIRVLVYVPVDREIVWIYKTKTKKNSMA